MGAHLRISWLRKRHNKLVVVRTYEVVVRAYMLHIITCTLFTDKSVVNIDARYM